jgi:undecaprenyl phosphate-alpha-L-ara4N flippase subunit ArnE
VTPFYAALFGGIALGVVGQIVLKYGTERSIGGGFLAQFLNPVTIAGLAVYFMAALLYILALKRIPLSIAYPSIAVSYVAVALAAHYLWGEPFGLQQITALALITGGILVLHH